MVIRTFQKNRSKFMHFMAKKKRTSILYQLYGLLNIVLCLSFTTVHTLLFQNINQMLIIRVLVIAEWLLTI